MKELAGLLRDGNMKEFYKIANKVLMIRASNPVVRSIKTGIEGEEEVTEDRVLVEEAIANYFKDIYKKPDYMQNIVNEDEEMKNGDVEEMAIDSSSELFKLSDISEAIKCSNFNKGLGPDCFDGNILQLNELLCSKVSLEIMDALNQGDIPEYLRVGRMVPLQKTSTKGPVALDEIRPIVVRSHISKIMEKAILAKVNESCPHLIESKLYQTGFKEGKSTAIHISRLLKEVQGKKRGNLISSLTYRKHTTPWIGNSYSKL